MTSPSSIGRWCELNNVEELSTLSEGLDFRLPKYRRKVFLDFYGFHLKYRAHPGCVYFYFPFLKKEFNLDTEQLFWLAFLNGNTQHLITSWMIFEKFPHIPNDLTELEKWFNENFTKLGWDLDRRHHKAKLIASIKSYKENLNGRSQEEYFNSFKGNNPYERFDSVWDQVINRFFSFGRLSTFSYLEYLRIIGLDIDCSQLFLEDLDGSKSHRNGLAKVLGRDDLDWHKTLTFDGKYGAGQIDWLKKEASILLDDAKQRFKGTDFENDVSYFTLESALCTYKSWHRKNRRYPSVYLDMFYDRIQKAQKAYPNYNLSPFWRGRKEYLPNYLLLENKPLDPGLKPVKQNHYRETGEVIMMSKDYPYYKNSFDDSIFSVIIP